VTLWRWFGLLLAWLVAAYGSGHTPEPVAEQGRALWSDLNAPAGWSLAPGESPSFEARDTHQDETSGDRQAARSLSLVPRRWVPAASPALDVNAASPHCYYFSDGARAPPRT